MKLGKPMDKQINSEITNIAYYTIRASVYYFVSYDIWGMSWNILRTNNHNDNFRIDGIR